MKLTTEKVFLFAVGPLFAGYTILKLPSIHFALLKLVPVFEGGVALCMLIGTVFWLGMSLLALWEYICQKAGEL